MVDINRVTLPQNFYDWTSDSLLIQPEPQYVLAEFILRALGASLPIPDQFGLPGREIGGFGADYVQPNDGQLILEKDIITDNLFAVKIDFDGQPGTTVRVNRPKYTDSTYTPASRIIDASTAISTTGIKIESEQAVLTLNRYGGPYSNANSQIQPFVITKLMAKTGVHDLAQVTARHLKRDFHKFLDSFGVYLGMLGGTTIYPKGVSAVNDITTTGSAPLTYEQLSRTYKYMAEDLKLPTLPDGRYVMLVTPTGEKQLKDDPQFARYAFNYEQKNPLFQSYTSLKYIIPEFLIFTASTLDKTANSSSVAVHTGLAMAPGCFGLGMGERPMVRNSTDDRYGLACPVIWSACLALEVMNSNFIVKVAYGADVN